MSRDLELEELLKAELLRYANKHIPYARKSLNELLNESYDKYRRARSRKKEFEKLCKNIPQIPDEFAENIIKGIADFDHSFRTPEVHGTGTIRKWSFTMYSLHETPLIEFGKYWNWLLPILSEIDRILKEMKEEK